MGFIFLKTTCICSHACTCTHTTHKTVHSIFHFDHDSFLNKFHSPVVVMSFSYDFLLTVSSLSISLLLEEDRCKLYCKAENFEFFFAMSGKVKDGTPCSPHKNDVCIDGICEVRAFLLWDVWSSLCFPVSNACCEKGCKRFHVRT